MELAEIRTLEDKIRNHQNNLLSSFLAKNGFSYSNIFDNCGRKALGEAMYQCLKDLVEISKTSWNISRDEFKDWIDEAFDELEDASTEDGESIIGNGNLEDEPDNIAP